MSHIVRRVALGAFFALACGLFPIDAARAAGGDGAADPGAAALRPNDSNEAQLTGGPQAYEDIYQTQTGGAQPGGLPGMQAVRNPTPEEHMLTAPGVPQAGGGAPAAARNARARVDDPYAMGGAAAQQPYGLGTGARPVYRLPY
ncbi:hypothetical protein [Paraburkholderia sp. BCC1885]|uniref:hypothetical protein n=1 Tax=Paraburkholderia sp. BCC1885 TaxID=2562669 RepID=UPI0011828C77|nr:hypothetical protein [Paraburkholderia sp. BCC1885]